MCWGSDGDGRLGNGGEDNTISKPTGYVINPDGETFKSIHAGHENTCGITDSENCIAGEIITTGKMA